MFLAYYFFRQLDLHADIYIYIYIFLKLVLGGDYIHTIDKSFQIILILIIVDVSVSTEHLFVCIF